MNNHDIYESAAEKTNHPIKKRPEMHNLSLFEQYLLKSKSTYSSMVRNSSITKP